MRRTRLWSRRRMRLAREDVDEVLRDFERDILQRSPRAQRAPR